MSSHPSERRPARTPSRRARRRGVSSCRPGLEALETRQLLDAKDIAGLRFFTTGTFLDNGATVSSTDVVTVGKIPTAGDFLPVFQLPGGVDIDLTAGKEAFTPRGELDIFANAKAQVLQASAGVLSISALQSASGIVFDGANPIDALGGKLGLDGHFGIALTSSGALSLASQLAYPALGNLSTVVGAPGVASAIVSAAGFGFGTDGAIPTLNGDLNLGGLSFRGGGLSIKVDTATQSASFYGGRTFNLKNNPVNVQFGDATTPGIVVTSGALASVNFAVTGPIKLGGLTVNARSLGGTYSASTSTYTIAGAASFSFKNNTVDIGLGSANSPGLVIANGAIKSFGFSINSSFTIGGLKLDVQNLGATYNDATSTLSIQGGATFKLRNNVVQVALTNFTLVDGQLKSLVFIVGANFQIGGVTLKAGDALGDVGANFIAGAYDDATSTFTLRGNTSLTAKGVDVRLAFGQAASGTQPASQGIIIRNGDLDSFDAAVTSKFTFSKVTFATKNLRLVYSRDNSRYTVTGDATLTYKALGRDNTLGVTLGVEGRNGLVIENGQLKELTARVNADFKVASLEVKVKNLTIGYNADRSEFGMYGAVALSTAPQGGRRVLDNFGVTLGEGSFRAPGILIQDGSLKTLDVRIDGAITISKLTLTSRSLRIRYSSDTNILQFTGGVAINLTGKIQAEVTLPGKGILINTDTGKVQVKGLEISAPLITFGRYGAKNVLFRFTEDDAGNQSITAGGILLLPRGIEVGGSFDIQNGQLRRINVSFHATPGIPIAKVIYLTDINAELKNLDNPEQIQFTGNVTASIGPTVKVGSRFVAVSKITGRIYADRNGLRLTGRQEYFGGLFGTGSNGTAELSWDGLARVHVFGEVSYPIAGIFRGKVDITMDASGNVNAGLRMGVYTPNFLPNPIKNRKLDEYSVSLQIRPNNPNDSFLSVNAPAPGFAIIFIKRFEVRINLNGNGRIWLNTRFGSDKTFDFRLFDDSGMPLASALPTIISSLNDPKGRIAQAFLREDDTLPGEGEAPPNDTPELAPAPTISFSDINFVSPDNLDLRVKFKATTSYPADTVIDFYAQPGNADYDGELITSVKYDPNTDEVVLPNLDELASPINNSSVPIYIYAVIRDNTRTDVVDRNQPVLSAYSPPIILPNLSLNIFGNLVGEGKPPVVVQSGSSYAFQANDILPNIGAGELIPEYEAKKDVRIDLTSSYGTFDFSGTAPSGATGIGTGDVALSGTVAEVRDWLNRLVYAPLLDSGDAPIQVAISRPSSAFLLAPEPVTINFIVNPLQMQLDPDTGGSGGSGAAATNASITENLVKSFDYTQGSGPATFFKNLRLGNADSNWIEGASIKIENFKPGFDFLSVPATGNEGLTSDQGGIATRFDGKAGILTLQGVASVADYQALIRQIQFVSNDRGPLKALVFSIGSDLGDERQARFGVNIAATNQPAQLIPSGIASLAPLTPKLVPIDVGITIRDPENDLISSAKVTIDQATYFPGQDVLSYTSGDGISGSWDPESSTLTLTGNGTTAAYTAALRRVTFGTLGKNQGVRNIIVTADDAPSGNTTATTTVRVIVGSFNFLSGAEILSGRHSITAPLDDTPIAVSPEPSLSSPDSSTLLGATFSIDNYVLGEDVLSVELAEFPDFTASFDAKRGVLTIAGTGDAETYRSILTLVQYRNEAVNRDARVRGIRIALRDGLSRGNEDRIELVVPVVPTLTSGTGSASYEESGTSVPVDPEITVGFDGDDLNGATVSLGEGYVPGEDFLDFTNQAGITGKFSRETGILTLTGSATVEDYQNALRSITYRNSRKNTDARFLEVSFTVTDVETTSDPVSSLVYINPDAVSVDIALAPTGTDPAPTPTFIQGGRPIGLVPSLMLISPDSTGQEPIQGATVRIQGYQPTEDALTYSLTGNIKATFDKELGAIYFTGEATLAEYQKVIRSIQYRNTGVSPDESPRSLSITLIDNNGPSDALNVPFNVVSLGKTPVRTAGAVKDISVLENAARTSLGLGAINYVGPGGKEKLVFTVTETPSAEFGDIRLADGTIPQTGLTYSLAQFRGAVFVPNLNVSGNAGRFTFTVSALNPLDGEPEADSLTQSLTIKLVGAPGGTATGTRSFLAQAIRDLTGANPTAADLQTLDNLLARGKTRADVITQFIGSPAFQNAVVTTVFRSTLGRAPSAAELAAGVKALKKGTLEAYKITLLSSAEFYKVKGGSTPAGFLTALFKAALNRAPNASEAKSLLAKAKTVAGRKQIAGSVVNSAEAINANVQAQSKRYLRRAALQPDAVNFAKLFKAKGSLALTVVLLGSDEYFKRYDGTNDTGISVESVSPRAASISLRAGKPFKTTFGKPKPGKAKPTATTTVAPTLTSSDASGFASVGLVGDSSGPHGGGVLIAPNFVLTAAHLVQGRALDDLTFTVAGQKMAVKSVSYAPGYDRSFAGTDRGNDLAILQLASPIAGVTPSGVLRDAPIQNETLTLVGFGSRNGLPFGVKQRGDTTIDAVSSGLIDWTYDKTNEVHTSPGDSGSPLFVKRGKAFYVAGIVSGGSSAGSAFGDIAFNTRVDNQAAWIDSVVNGKSASKTKA